MNVRIYKPCKSAMQSGFAKGDDWVLEYKLDGDKDIEPLMGWISSDDTLNSVKVNFKTCDDAVSFADKKGWDYDIIPSKERNIKPKSYLDNFK